MRLSALAALVCAAAALASCDQPTPTDGGPTAPPDLAVRVTLDSTVLGSLEGSEQWDEFVVNVSSTEFRVALQARSGSAEDTVVAEIFDDTKVLRGSVSSAGNAPALGAQPGPWLKPAGDASWRVRVRRQSGAGGPYSLRLFSRNPAPEHAAAEVVSGQTVETEKLDVVGDLDTFRFTGRKAEEWTIFLQPTGPYSWITMELVEEATGKTVKSTVVRSYLTTFWTPRIALPEDGAYLVRIWGEDVALLPGYRFGVQAVNPAPERGDARVEVGQVVAEEIGSIADVDDYQFTIPAGREAMLRIQLEGWTRPSLAVDMQWNGSSWVRRATIAKVSPSLDDPGARLLLPAGEYVMRLSSDVLDNVGQYRFAMSFYTPEAGGVLTVNGPAVEAAIDEPGDQDVYPFAGTRGDMVVMEISSPSSPAETVEAWVEGRSPSGRYEYVFGARSQGARPGYSNSYTLEHTRTYTLRVIGRGQTPASGVAYSLRLYTISPEPEHVPAEVRVGERVEGERVDQAGDRDAFTLMGQAGQEVNLFLGTDDPEGEMYISINPYGSSQSWSHPETTTGSSALDGRSTGRFTLEARLYQVYVTQSHPPEGILSPNHPYTFRVFPIDRRPEARAQAYVPGDTVGGEPLYPAGDIDEYTFTLSAPATVDVFWDAPFTTARDEVTARLTSVTTGAVHWTTRHTLDGAPVRTVALPAGSYRISILNESVDASVSYYQQGPPDKAHTPTLRYRFAIMPR